jgi:hypothetical protein
MARKLILSVGLAIVVAATVVCARSSRRGRVADWFRSLTGRRRTVPADEEPFEVRTTRSTDPGDVDSEDQGGSWADDGGLLPSGTQAVG